MSAANLAFSPGSALTVDTLTVSDVVASNNITCNNITVDGAGDNNGIVNCNDLSIGPAPLGYIPNATQLVMSNDQTGTRPCRYFETVPDQSGGGYQAGWKQQFAYPANPPGAVQPIWGFAPSGCAYFYSSADIVTPDIPGLDVRVEGPTAANSISLKTTLGGIAIVATTGSVVVTQSAARQGVSGAIVAGGSVTVNAPSVAAGTVVHLSLAVAGGTVGAPFVQTLTPNVGFTIASTNALDTSTVAWMLLN